MSSFFSKGSVPFIPQSEISDCGMACIAMISSYYGHKVNLNRMRQLHPTSAKGATLDNIANLAEKMSLQPRGVKVEMAGLANLALPCILHWGLSHFVILTKVSKKSITIIDPAKGKLIFKKRGSSGLTTGMPFADDLYTGIALELKPKKEFTKKNDEITMSVSELWGDVSGIKGTLFKVFLLSVLLQVFALITPLYMQIVVDDVIIGSDLNLLSLIGGGFTLLILITALVGLIRFLIVLHFGNQISMQMTTNVFHHMIRLPLDFFEKRHIGDIVTRFHSITNVKKLLAQGVVESFVDGLLVIGTLILMFQYSSKLSLMVLLFVSLYIFVRLALLPLLKLSIVKQISMKAKEHSGFIESVRAIQSIKLFTQESNRESTWSSMLASSINADSEVYRMNFFFQFSKELLFGLEVVLITYLGAIEVINNTLSVGMLFAFIAYKIQFTTKISSSIERFIEFRMLKVHLGRIADIAMTPKESVNGNLPVVPEIIGEIEVRNLSFRYSDEEPFLIRNLSCVFKKGESTAIIGPSGCGKTTLIKLLLGILKPVEGQILIDGIDIHQYGLKYYRKQVSAVMQSDTLLSGAIVDVISFSNSKIDMPRVIEAAMMASIHDDIMKMPMGYESFIGEAGNSLSGGQRLRLILARAIYSKPKILILDEATSHLDLKLEKIVNEAVKKIQITKIIVAHRKETYNSADRILKLTSNALVDVNAQGGQDAS